MKFLRAACAATLLFATSLGAVPISQFTQLAPADRAELDRLEAVLFNLLETKGTENGMVAYYTSLGAAERLDVTMRGTFKEIDQKCGSVVSVERYKTEPFGSRVVRETFVAMHGPCPIRWQLLYVKRGPTWAFDRFSFLSFDGNEW